MFEPLVRMAAAVMLAGVIALAITAAPATNGAALTQDAKQPQTAAKADRLRVPVKGAACSVHGWPAFEPKCQFDIREPAGEARTVRVIALR